MTAPGRALSSTADLALVPEVTAAQRGDRQAFARLVDATRQTVCAIAIAVLRDDEASRDVAQDVYLAAWRALPTLRNPASFLPWLRQLARNQAHQTLRTTVRRRRREVGDRADLLLAAAADPRPDAEARLVAAEERAALAAALAELPDAAREVVVLYYREGGSTAQVAALLGLSEAAVRQRLARARAQVRARLLEDAGAALRRTAPGAAFTVAVMTALTMAVPATAAAATLGAAAAAKGSAGASGAAGAGAAAAKLAAKAGLAGAGGALAGVIAGFAGGAAAVLGGARMLHALARDDEERRGIHVYAVVSLLAVVGFLATVLLAPHRLPVTLAFFAMELAFFALHFAWLPRVTRRRYAAERREDPIGASLVHRRRRRQAVLGCLAGFVLGGLPIVAAWIWRW